MLLISFCNKKQNDGEITLKELVNKSNKSGFHAIYNESLNVNKPDLKNITDPKLFGFGNCGLDDDTEIIKVLENIQNNSKVSMDAVSSDTTAVRIAVTSFCKIYGKDKIEGEKPFHAKLKDGIWYVYGSLPSKYDKGGTAEAEIIKKTGKIIRITHGK
jgi:hypothetical protein